MLMKITTFLMSLSIMLSVQTLSADDVFYFCLIPGIAAPQDYVAELSINTAIPAMVSISREDGSLNKKIITGANDFNIMKFTALEAQPTTKYDFSQGTEKPFERVYEKAAIKVLTHNYSGITSCYVKTNYGNKSDVMTLLKEAEIGTDYQISHNTSKNQTAGIQTSYVAIVALNDNTKITFTMGGCSSCFVPLENTQQLLPGKSTIRTIKAGDVWLIPASGTTYGSLSGSKVSANAPIAVFSGNNSSYNSDPTKTNYTIIQERPINMWGNHHLVPSLLGRVMYPKVQIFSETGENDIFLDGVKKWYLQNPGGIINLGYIEEFTGFKTDDGKAPNPQVITSDYAMNVVMMNAGKTLTNNAAKPFQMQILPTEYFRLSGTFKISNPEDECITLVFTAFEEGKIPDNIYFAEVVNGTLNWMKLKDYSPDAGQKFFGTYPDGSHFRSKNMSFSKGGIFAIKSENPFAIYQYKHPSGDQNSGFGFNVAGDIFELDTPDNLAPTIEFEEFAGTILGTVYDEPKSDVQKASKLGLLYMVEEDSYNFSFSHDSYQPGVTNSTQWRLDILDKSKDARARVVFMDLIGNRLDTIFESPAKIPVITPKNADFGLFSVKIPELTKLLTFDIVGQNELQIGDNYEMYLILDSDNEETKEGDITESQNFDIVNLREINLYPLLKVGKTEIEVEFTARELGDFKDSLGVIILTRDSKTNEVQIEDVVYFAELIAKVGENAINAEDYDFGQVLLSKPEYFTLSVKNDISGDNQMDLEINGIKLRGDDIGLAGSNKIFEVQGLENISKQNPKFLKPGESLNYVVKFEPKEEKQYSAEIIFEADNSVPDNIGLITGMGTVTSVNDELRISSNIEVKVDNGMLILTSLENYFLDIVEIYDLSGRLVHSQKVNEYLNGYSVGIDNFNRGVNFIKMNINNSWISKKVIL